MPNAKMKQGPSSLAPANEIKVLNMIPPSKIKKEPVSPQKPAAPALPSNKSSSVPFPPKLTNGISCAPLPSKPANLPGNHHVSNGTDGKTVPGSSEPRLFTFPDPPSLQVDVKPKLSRLASLNAIAKVHVLMERTVRHKLPPKRVQAPPNNLPNLEAVDVKPNIELLRSQVNAAKTQASTEAKSKPQPAKKPLSRNKLRIKNNLRPAVAKNVNLAKKPGKKATTPSATSMKVKKLSQKVLSKLKLPKLIQIKKEKDSIPSASGDSKSKPQAVTKPSAARAEAKEKKKKVLPLPDKKAKSGGPLEAASKRMASINAKAILALNSHKDTATKTKKKILRQITSRAKLKKKAAALATATDKAAAAKKRKLSTQSASSTPPAKKPNKEASSTTTTSPKTKKRPYRRKSVQTVPQTKASPTYCYPHFQSPVHYSTSPIIFHGYDYNAAPAIMDNYPAAPPPPPTLVEQVGIGTFGSCCRGCPATDPLLHPIHEVCVLSSHSCHHCSPCGGHHPCHHFPATFHAQKVESAEPWQQSPLNKMVKQYQKKMDHNILPNLKSPKAAAGSVKKGVAASKPEEAAKIKKGDPRLVKCSKAAEKPLDDEAQVSSTTDVHPVLTILPLIKKQAPHGWSWLGEPYEKLVYKSNDEAPTLKLCYPAIHHIEGDTISERDCVLLRSGKRSVDPPFVAKISAFWENEEGDMMMSLLWYYRPDNTDRTKRHLPMEDELFASKHRDINGVGCIEDKCYVLTFLEYCRFHKEARRLREKSQPRPVLVPKPDNGYPRSTRLPIPGAVNPDSVMFCRQVYDFRQKRLLKNPS